MGVSRPVSGRVVMVRVRSLSRWVIPGEESYTWADVNGLDLVFRAIRSA